MATERSTTDARLTYALYGALFGLAFPVMATLLDVYARDLGMNLAGIITAQQTQPLHWMIDTAPIFLGLFAMIAGSKQQEVLEINAGLEDTVQQRTSMLLEQNEQLRAMQDELQVSMERISQSINYAQRIQDAIITNTAEMKAAFPDSFIMFRPRDVVSGDFPWYLEKNGYHYVAAVDCTGHGVPGAFMSLIGYFLLSRIVKEQGITETGDILCALHLEVVKVLNQDSDQQVHDGMDIALCRIDRDNGEIQYSGAGNPVYHISGNDLTEYKADIWSIGGTQYRKRCPYRAQTFSFKQGDVISMFSDGITDQFSNDGSAKFGYSRIRTKLLEVENASLKEVGTDFEEMMEQWMGDHRQMDDMLLIGVRL